MWGIHRILAVQLVLAAASIASVKCDCTDTDDECVFYLDVDRKLTMMDGGTLVFADNGKLYRYDVKNTSNADPYPMDNIVTADGWHEPRLLYAVNGTLPGPDIIVYEGQTVTIFVKNSLHSDTLTIHWHGIDQLGTPWMDGVAYINQCPIGPGQSLKYRFLVDAHGTYWWHSHVGEQRSMGVYGALVVRKKAPLAAEEHILQVSDWDHNYISSAAGLGINRYENGQLRNRSVSLDGQSTGIKIDSGLINGKGRYYDPDTGLSNMAPVTVFNVTKNSRYRFRVINAAAWYAFRISVDDHTMSVVATDGHDIEPVEAESVVVHPGERFDFEIETTQEVGNYWIRAITLVKGNYKRADAILRYDGAAKEEPVTTRQTCRRSRPCVVVNCPFLTYPEPFTVCVGVGELKAASFDLPAPAYAVGKFQEFFLNFGFPGNESQPASVNGHSFYEPDVSLVTQPTEWNKPCEEPECGEYKICRCTYALNFHSGDTVQIILTNMGKGRGWSHPIHIHGHSFYVIKTGYGTYNSTTAEIEEDSDDIDCRGNPIRTQSFCNRATWTNSSWENGNIPGAELIRPPRKDTVIVPTGGYVVLRIRGDNPGIWNAHCHLEPHNVGGMRFLLNESFNQIPSPPADFPRCSSFPPTVQAPVDLTTTELPLSSEYT